MYPPIHISCFRALTRPYFSVPPYHVGFSLPALLSAPNTTPYYWDYYAIKLYFLSPAPIIAFSETLRGLSRSCDKVAALCSQPNIALSSLIARRRHSPPTKSTAILET